MQEYKQTHTQRPTFQPWGIVSSFIESIECYVADILQKLKDEKRYSIYSSSIYYTEYKTNKKEL